MINPYMIVAGIVGAAATFGTGFLAGMEVEGGRCDGRLLSEMMGATQVLDLKNNELTQARAQIDKFNRAVDQQKNEIAALRRQEAAARAEAQEEARERAIAAEQARNALQNVLSQLKVTIDETDFGPCAGEPIPDNFVELLNAALAAEASLSDGRNGELPASPGGDGP